MSTSSRGRGAGRPGRRHALNVRLLETELGANLELAWKTVLEESSSYTATAVPGGGLNYLPQVDPVSPRPGCSLDVPDPGQRRRCRDRALLGGWRLLRPALARRGPVLERRRRVYVAADETLDAVAWGVARTALPDTDLPFQTDLTSQLQITMVSGSSPRSATSRC